MQNQHQIENWASKTFVKKFSNPRWRPSNWFRYVLSTVLHRKANKYESSNWNTSESSATTTTGLLMYSSSNRLVGQEVNEGSFVGGIPKESFLGNCQAHFFGERHCCANVMACTTLMGFILGTGGMISFKNYHSIGITATHMSNVWSAYFSIVEFFGQGNLWSNPPTKKPIYLLANNMVWAAIHKKSSSCSCWRLWSFPVASLTRRSCW